MANAKVTRTLNLNEAANVLGITPAEMSEMIDRGEVEGKETSEGVRVAESQIRAFKQKNWTAEGFAGLMASSLQIEVFGEEWNLAIHRSDDKIHALSSTTTVRR